MESVGERRSRREPSPQASSLRLSVVIPAYNESPRLAAGMSRLTEAVEAGRIEPESTEFVLVDDGSADDTLQFAESLLRHYPHRQLLRLEVNLGKGGAVRAGVAAATAPIIAFADADMSIDPAQTPEFVQALERSDVAIGSRAAAGASVDRPSIRRSAMNRAFNQMVNLLTRVSLNDTQCGFKAFRAPVAKLLFHLSITERFAFDVEILSIARRLGLTIDEVPVHWSRIEGSRVRPWLDPGSMTRDVWRASRRAAAAPPVTALVFRPDGIETTGTEHSVALKAIRQELSPVLPVLLQPNGGLMVLCPLMDEEKVAEMARRMASHLPGGTVQRSRLTFGQLVSMAPLDLAWDA